MSTANTCNEIRKYSYTFLKQNNFFKIGSNDLIFFEKLEELVYVTCKKISGKVTSGCEKKVNGRHLPLFYQDL